MRIKLGLFSDLVLDSIAVNGNERERGREGREASLAAIMFQTLFKSERCK